MSPIPPPSTSSSEPPSPDSTTSSATDAGPQRNPARMVAFIVAILVVVLMTWYVLTDRHAPYTSRGTVSTWVTLIGPRVGGQVGEVFVHDNQQVRQGTPLFALDPRPFEVAVQQAEATLAQATQGIDASSAALAASQADVAQARVNLANTRLATARTLELEQHQLVSRADGDNARASVKTAEAQLRAALAGLRSAELQLGAGGADNPQIRQAQAQLEQAQLNLLYATVEAPRDGLVTNLQLAVGQYASAGAQVLTFVDSDGAWVVADMRENQLGNIRPGDRAGILFDAVPGTIFEGRVHSIAGAIDPGRTFSGGLLQTRRRRAGSSRRGGFRYASSLRRTRRGPNRCALAQRSAWSSTPVGTAARWAGSRHCCIASRPSPPTSIDFPPACTSPPAPCLPTIRCSRSGWLLPPHWVSCWHRCCSPRSRR